MDISVSYRLAANWKKNVNETLSLHGRVVQVMHPYANMFLIRKTHEVRQAVQIKPRIHG